ncbi:peptigoglycan-binding protein LysM [Streptomyces sp. MUSC 125]|nr:peptigoglycan-binding protein LysM [Streptomyces sp. MUSC 125]
MLSGNGRHRRPRQAPALLVAAGVTGSAIAIPLLGAASANAADGTTWDKVAECESGGSWSADTGNGYYGGLQISQDDWVKYGGSRYADSPDQASRSQQIAVAEEILGDQSTAPWATCAQRSGLTPGSGAVDVDTGVGGLGGAGGANHSGGLSDSSTSSSSVPLSPSSSGSSSFSPSGPSSSTPSSPSSSSPSSPGSSLPGSPSSDVDTATGTGTGTGTGSGSDSDPGSGLGPGSSPGSTPVPGYTPGEDAATDPGMDADLKGSNATKSDKSVSSGAGYAQGGEGSSAAGPNTDNSGTSRQGAGSWSLVDTGTLDGGGRHRGESAEGSVKSGQKGEVLGRHASREPGTYTVREGDSLTSIADSFDVDGGWRALYAGNKGVVGADPDHIVAGQTLEVGAETGAK